MGSPLPGSPATNPNGVSVARKPNYQFERMERDRAKAAKAAEKAAAKRLEQDSVADTGADTQAPSPKRDD